MTRRKLPFLTVALAMLFVAAIAFGQTDPGVRGGAGGAGQGIASVADNTNDNAFFQSGLAQLSEAENVTNNGLGLRFNSNSCLSCPAQPAAGGSGAAVNPQFAFAGSSVAPKDTTPFFITQNGPTREARFPFFFNANGTANTNNPNGGVEDLFTVTGRTDAGACSLSQPSFNAANAANNLIFRIPTPVFGTGLMANIDDSTLQNNPANNLNNNLGIGGDFNPNGNNGPISLFPCKTPYNSCITFPSRPSTRQLTSST